MPRKTRDGAAERPPWVDPSMRPRPDAAENRVPPAPAVNRAPAFNEAAARCRGKPHWTRIWRGSRRRPSMRPRPDAAENHQIAAPLIPLPRAFNEAAARCRGKPLIEARLTVLLGGLQ